MNKPYGDPLWELQRIEELEQETAALKRELADAQQTSCDWHTLAQQEIDDAE